MDGRTRVFQYTHHSQTCTLKKNLHNEMQMYLTFSLFKLVLFFCIISYTTDVIVFFYTDNCWVMVMVFNATFNNISVILWRSVLLVEETGVRGENH